MVLLEYFLQSQLLVVVLGVQGDMRQDMMVVLEEEVLVLMQVVQDHKGMTEELVQLIT